VETLQIKHRGYRKLSSRKGLWESKGGGQTPHFCRRPLRRKGERNIERAATSVSSRVKAGVRPNGDHGTFAGKRPKRAFQLNQEGEAAPTATREWQTKRGPWVQEDPEPTSAIRCEKKKKSKKRLRAAIAVGNLEKESIAKKEKRRRKG